MHRTRAVFPCLLVAFAVPALAGAPTPLSAATILDVVPIHGALVAGGALALLAALVLFLTR